MASVADVSLLVTKITFVVAEMINNEDVITSYVAEITFVVAEIIMKEYVISSAVIYFYLSG